MAWDQLWIDKPHIAYALIGGFVTVFSLISLFVKEKLYIGEATVATIFGLVIGPHCLNWFSPVTWGNTDYITIEVSRIVLVVQIFAVAVELPKKYMLKHWLSVSILLIPVMTFGWLISSVFVWKLVPSLSWVEGLVIAACVTATDPVLASAVVGKGKFAQRVPGHLRNILSAESGCNDGMAFPFAYLALNLVKYSGNSHKIAFEFIVITVLYECIFGCIVGAVIGYCGRHLIKFAEKKNLIDRESFLVFYFVLALLCTGVGTIIGVDDLLVSFAAGTAFAWDGWFARKTEESHVSNVIDLLLNMAYFVYLGAIVPWEQFNNSDIGLSAWKLVILAIIILVVRRIPIMLAMKPFIPDIRTWREALFCGHFGPIGVGAVFISILARAELEHGEPTPLADLPAKGSTNYYAIATIWPITTFLVIASIIVHGSSIAVFTLGKRLNNMTITMTYTTNTTSQPSWLSRLPGLESGRTLSFHKVDTKDPGFFGKSSSKNNKAKPAGGMKRRKRRSGVTSGPAPDALPIDLGSKSKRSTMLTDDDRHPAEHEIAMEEKTSLTPEERPPEETAKGANAGDDIAAYQEGDNIIVEDYEGEVIAEIKSKEEDAESSVERVSANASSSSTQVSSEKGEDAATAPSITPTASAPDRRTASPSKRDARSRPHAGRKVFAYQLDDTLIIENDEGEVIRRYKINRRQRQDGQGAESSSAGAAAYVSRPRSGSLVDKTLSFVGLKKLADSMVGSSELSSSQEASSSKTPGDKDVELEIHPDKTGGVPKDSADFDDKVVTEKLKVLLKDNAGRLPAFRGSDDDDNAVDDNSEEDDSGDEQKYDIEEQPARRSNTRSSQRSTPQLNLAQNFLGHHDSDDDDDIYDTVGANDDEETEVERRRRLAALGLLNGDDDDDEEDDEEDRPRTTRSGAASSGANRRHIPGTIAENDEEEEEGTNESTSRPPQNSIQWGPGVKK